MKGSTNALKGDLTSFEMGFVNIGYKYGTGTQKSGISGKYVSSMTTVSQYVRIQGPYLVSRRTTTGDAATCYYFTNLTMSTVSSKSYAHPLSISDGNSLFFKDGDVVYLFAFQQASSAPSYFFKNHSDPSPNTPRLSGFIVKCTGHGPNTPATIELSGSWDIYNNNSSQQTSASYTNMMWDSMASTREGCIQKVYEITGETIV